MKNLILTFAVFSLLVGCSSQDDQKAREQANIELVKNYVKAVEELDFEAMGSFLDEKYMGLGPSFGDTIYKAAAIENWKNNVENLYEKIKYNKSKFAAVTIAEGDNKGEWVANWAELKIKFKGEEKEVTIWANVNYMIENGKIARSLTFYNEADALRQLGYLIVPPDAVK